MPGQTGSSRVRRQAGPLPLQWRAGQLPGQTWAVAQSRIGMHSLGLQWRAGQLPGQTGASRALEQRSRPRFNGGPGNCPAKPQRLTHWTAVVGRCRASMEGRAIARPNLMSCKSLMLLDEIASMEGRAIARPNEKHPQPVRAQHGQLQWRAGQLPGQTRSLGVVDHSPAPFNGGPGNCPAKLDHGGGEPPSMEGRAIARPNYDLRHRSPAAVEIASMEGRAIARPNRPRNGWTWATIPVLQWRAGQLPGQTGVFVDIAGPALPSMEGRAIARPNTMTWQATSALADRASMEGRAIARPNRRRGRRGSGSGSQLPSGLQWRAGQLPGQTRCASGSVRRTMPSSASMEGRAIARPNRRYTRGGRSRASVEASMEGRAIARPNTGFPDEILYRGWSFNGGPGNCPAKHGNHCSRSLEPRRSASMEGRAIARPNAGIAGRKLIEHVRFELQWRAGQLPGQTGQHVPVATDSNGSCFNGGPGNCPAKPDVSGHAPCAV